MPFVEIVGFTSTWKNYNLAAAFLSSEKEDNYSWVMSALREICDTYGETPCAIVTDRDLALMNAVEKTFPNVTHMLCRRHINKNIEDFGKTKMKDDVLAKMFAGACMNLFDSQTEEEYARRLNNMCIQWKGRTVPLLNYLQKQWLNPYKRKFVSAWTDTVLNFRCNTTNMLVNLWPFDLSAAGLVRMRTKEFSPHADQRV